MTNGRGGPVLPSPKAVSRSEARARRGELRDRHPGAGLAIADHFFSIGLWNPTLTIAGYAPMADEADVMPLLENLASRGARLALPVVVERDAPLLFRQWRPGDELVPGAHGSRQPSDAAKTVTPDLVLVPLLAFDAAGTRLGFGGGYYDRTLAALRGAGSVLAIGVAYRGQEVAALPYEPHDQRLDWIVTESGAWEFAE